MVTTTFLFYSCSWCVCNGLMEMSSVSGIDRTRVEEHLKNIYFGVNKNWPRRYGTSLCCQRQGRCASLSLTGLVFVLSCPHSCEKSTPFALRQRLLSLWHCYWKSSNQRSSVSCCQLFGLLSASFLAICKADFRHAPLRFHSLAEQALIVRNPVHRDTGLFFCVDEFLMLRRSGISKHPL